MTDVTLIDGDLGSTAQMLSIGSIATP